MPEPKKPKRHRPKEGVVEPLNEPYFKEPPREEFGHDDRPAVDTTLPGSEGPKTGPQKQGQPGKDHGKPESTE